jgi:hypothetical protein
MDPHHEKQTKQCQDVVGTSKRGHSDKGLVGRHPIPPHHHPSHSSEEEDDRELLKRQTPFEQSSHLAICYSKKSKQSTINDNHEAPIYEGNKQSCDPCFCLSSTWIGTGLSISTRRSSWWRLSGSIGPGWHQGGIQSSTKSRQHVMSWN